MKYVINTETGVVHHEGADSEQYVRNAQSLFPSSGPFTIVEGAKARDEVKKAVTQK